MVSSVLSPPINHPIPSSHHTTAKLETFFICAGHSFTAFNLMEAAMADGSDGRHGNDTPATISARQTPSNSNLTDQWVSWNDFVLGGFQIYSKLGRTLAEKLREPRNVFQAAIEEGFFSA
ncbi:hypothetical protein SUGI_1097520 [Cryptomeria japonica]|nr:hypothetical protein SUGI_1097520 [Cryptomeria japonica]